ncbi:lipase, class 2 [Calothrix sp. NIES-4101]|nr:lipase, class 2 [Calothrix sp. NIES-4101]
MEIENNNHANQNQLVLVHGINDTGAVFDKMATVLRNQGWLVHTLDLVPNNGDVGLDKLAQQLAKYIAISFPEEQAIDIIGFSMGGIVSRYYIQRLGGIKRVQRFITISSPHYGTVMAYASQRPGCMQMRPDSLFLKDLNADVNMLKQINFTSIWTPYDLMIVPATSSQMSFGREVIVPALIHPWMLTDIRTIKTVAEALGAT